MRYCLMVKITDFIIKYLIYQQHVGPSSHVMLAAIKAKVRYYPPGGSSGKAASSPAAVQETGETRRFLFNMARRIAR